MMSDGQRSFGFDIEPPAKKEVGAVALSAAQFRTIAGWLRGNVDLANGLPAGVVAEVARSQPLIAERHRSDGWTQCEIKITWLNEATIAEAAKLVAGLEMGE